jgi:hypothetical protein
VRAATPAHWCRLTCVATLLPCCRAFRVFKHVAETVHFGLLELGLDSTLSYCDDIRTRCLTPLAVDNRQVWSGRKRVTTSRLHSAFLLRY